MRMPVFVTRPESKLSVKDGRLVVVVKDPSAAAPSTTIEFPFRRISSVVTYGAPSISSAVLDKLLQFDIQLHMFSRRARYIGTICKANPRSTKFSFIYWSIINSPKDRFFLAGQILIWKLQSQYDLAMKIATRVERMKKAAVQHRAAYFLQQIKHIKSQQLGIAVLLGIEGQCSKLHYNNLSDAIVVNQKFFYFNARSRRPPLDSFNALLSLLYSLLLSEVAISVIDAGLDVNLGFLHSSLEKPKLALALDLMEPFRASLAERVALRLINLRMLSEEHFEIRNFGVYLNQAGLKIASKEWLAFLIGKGGIQQRRLKIRANVTHFKSIVNLAYDNMDSCL